MALADTARLVASLELQDKFSATAKRFDSTLSGMERRTSTLSRIGSEAGRGLQTAARNTAVGLVAGGIALTTQITAGIRSLAELEEATAQTEARLKSTGGAANVTAEGVRTLSQELETLTTIDDKAIQRGQNLLLTFTNIRNEVGKGNDIFNQATRTVLDLATAMGTEPEQAALQLGKALNDPIRGLTALRRVGVQFTADQEDQIRALVESGRVMEAQKVILAELNKEFGGSAEAFAKGPGATMRRFADAVEEGQQALARGFLPLMERLSGLAQDAFNDPKVLAGIENFGEGLAGGLDQLVDIASKLPWEAIGSSLQVAGAGAKAVLTAFTSLPPWVQTAVLTGWGLNKLTGGALGNIVGMIGKQAFGALRGATPANPVFVSQVGPGGAAGAGAGGGLGFAGGVLLTAGAGATIAGGVMALDSLNKAIAEGSKEGIKEGVLDFTGGFPALIGNFVQETFFPQGPKDGGTNAGTTPLGQFDPANRGGTVPVSDKEAAARLDRLQGGFEGSMRSAIDTSKLTLEQRLIKDETFKQGLNTKEFLRLLAKTSEFGKKGEGTAIEVGPKTGRDPVGDAFLALVGRLEKPALRSAEVQGEIDRHIQALETVQSDLIREGNFAAARHAQRNLNEMYRLIGEVDKTHPLLRENVQKQERIAERISEAREAIGSGFSSSNSHLDVIAGKDFSPNVNVGVSVVSNVSISDVQRKITSQQIAIGRGPLEFAG